MPVNYYGNHFLKELLRCDSAAQFTQQVMAQLNYLAQHDGIYTPKIDEAKYNDRRHEIARNLQTEIKEVELAAWRAEHYDLMRRDADYERWGRREMVRLGIPEEDWGDHWRQHREHLKLLKDDEDYRTWGVTWMEQKGESIADMPTRWKQRGDAHERLKKSDPEYASWGIKLMEYLGKPKREMPIFWEERLQPLRAMAEAPFFTEPIRIGYKTFVAGARALQAREAQGGLDVPRLLRDGLVHLPEALCSKDFQ